MFFVFLLVSIFFTKLFCILAKDTLLMDKPNDRSMHVVPTIRGGGIVFIGLPLCAIPILGYFYPSQLPDALVLMGSSLLIALISFWDDLYHLTAKQRFLVHGVAVLLCALFLKPNLLDVALFSVSNSIAIGFLILVMGLWAINHFNFMDGLDGFCALQAIMLFFGYFILFRSVDAGFYYELCSIFIACIIGFLFFNFPPAKLFMGDIGSASLGLITFGLALIAQKNYQIPLYYWFILNAVFLFDATITLLRRIFNKESWIKPHRMHAYQRLKQSGVETSIILFGQLLLNIIFLSLVLLLYSAKISLLGVVLFQCIILLTVYYCIERMHPMFQNNKTVALKY